MKNLKLATGIFIMLLISSTIVFSQTNKTVKNQNGSTTKTASVNGDPNFVDKNHDGVCDKHPNTQCKQVQGKNFVDKNNDGICDNCGNKKANCKDENCKAKQSNCKPNGCGNGQKQPCSRSCGSHNK